MRHGGVILNVPTGQWRSLKSLRSGTVLYESKDSPWKPIGDRGILVV